MENRSAGKAMLPLVIIFIVISVVVYISRAWLQAQWNADHRVLLVGNAILFLATGFSFYLYSKALRNSNVQVFLRMMYSSLLAKMFLCLGATAIYLMLAGKEVNKGGIIGCFVFYIIYTWVEIKVLMGLSKKQPKNG